MRRVRCAIYTRKSTEEGLEQDFNSLNAQREACEAYIESQKHEGWELLPDTYDDGGLSGGSLERPALQRLMRAVDDKHVDQVVVYKIDRLTRSLADFAKLVERLDAAQASFVSVTQSFNTATSMGRLTLNVLLSFAQFEREVTAERIRDKIAASKKKGLWMGGTVPLGYRAHGRTLKIDEEEAQIIRTLYNLYRDHGSLREVKERAQALGIRSRRRERADGQVTGGGVMLRGHIHHILSNPIYAGRIRHKDQMHDGQHHAIIDPDLWDEVQKMLKDGAAKGRGSVGKASRSPLAGKLFDETGDRLTPSHSRKNGRRLRYYISRRLVTGRSHEHPDAWRLPAQQVESLLADLVRQHLGQPDAAPSMLRDMAAAGIVSAAGRLKKTGDATACLRLIERSDLRPGSIAVRLDRNAMARALGCIPDQINSAGLVIEAPFRMRRRGVELKLHLGPPPPEIDRTLVSNIVKARRWLQMVIAGKTFTQIAEAEATSAQRVRKVIDLALLAPDIIETIACGEQPDGLGSDHLIRTGIPALWPQQREIFARL